MVEYVAAVNDIVRRWNNQKQLHETKGVAREDSCMDARIMLSIDPKMTAQQAEQVVDLAVKCRPDTNDGADFVVGVDLCGNPTKGDVSQFTASFRRAKAYGLRITVHFAEVPRSGVDAELETLLSWQPDRLGHVIQVSPKYAEIRKRKLGLELCLSCNVLAKLTPGGFAMHHFGEWRETDCPIALSVRIQREIQSGLVAYYSTDGRRRHLRKSIVKRVPTGLAALRTRSQRPHRAEQKRGSCQLY